MKKILLGLGLAIMASVSLLSCSKGDYNSGSGQTGYNTFADKNNKPIDIPSGTFTAKINGSDFSAKSAYAYFAKINSERIFHIVGFKTSLKDEDGLFLFTTSKDKGNYGIDFGNSINAGTYTPTGSTSSVFATIGNIEITESTDTRVKGKFNFKGPGGLEITDGVFDVAIIDYGE